MSTCWAYHVVDFRPTSRTGLTPDLERDQIQSLLDSLGAQGWELVQVGPAAGTAAIVRLYFKKPL